MTAFELIIHYIDLFYLLEYFHVWAFFDLHINGLLESWNRFDFWLIYTADFFKYISRIRWFILIIVYRSLIRSNVFNIG